MEGNRRQKKNFFSFVPLAIAFDNCVYEEDVHDVVVCAIVDDVVDDVVSSNYCHIRVHTLSSALVESSTIGEICF